MRQLKSAQDIISRDGDSVKPRIFKLLAYCYAGSGDSTKALDQMNTYFAKQDTTDRVVKDYLLAAALIETVQHDTAAVVAQFEQAVAAEKIVFSGWITSLNWLKWSRNSAVAIAKRSGGNRFTNQAFAK